MGLFSKKSKVIEIFAPTDGEIVGLDKVDDEVFREKMMGDGFAIIPTNDNFVAPMAGVMATVFPTNHAYGIKHTSGVELLLHIGLDTVTLEGKGMTSKVKQDSTVEVGTPLAVVKLKEVAKLVPSITTPIVFPNLEGKTIEIVKIGKVKAGELVAVLK